MNDETKQVDLTRLNRKQRRNISTQVGNKIMGRNLPYVKSKWLSLEEFNAQREKEIAEETKSVDKV